MSIDASKLFFNPNCIVVNAKLNIKFKMKGKAIIKVISFLINIRNTFPKETVIKIYKTVQTGPNNHAGGDQVGFIS